MCSFSLKDYRCTFSPFLWRITDALSCSTVWLNMFKSTFLKNSAHQSWSSTWDVLFVAFIIFYFLHFLIFPAGWNMLKVWPYQYKNRACGIFFSFSHMPSFFTTAHSAQLLAHTFHVSSLIPIISPFIPSFTKPLPHMPHIAPLFTHPKPLPLFIPSHPHTVFPSSLIPVLTQPIPFHSS